MINLLVLMTLTIGILVIAVVWLWFQLNIVEANERHNFDSLVAHHAMIVELQRQLAACKQESTAPLASPWSDALPDTENGWRDGSVRPDGSRPGEPI